MQISFFGKTALVTGAGSGIGAAIAEQLAAAGANVIVQDLHPGEADKVADRIRTAGFAAEPITGDVSRPEDWERTITATIAKTGALHLLVNNAGIAGALAPTADYPLESWRQVMSVNLDGAFYGMRFGIPAMLASGGGAIVNVASILGSVGYANAVAYTAAKHALLGMTKVAALEYAAKGIRVNAIGPGFIDTPMLSGLPPGAKEALVAQHPIGRLGTPEDVANLATFLLSDKAGFITGSYHLVDGGYTAQ